MRCGLALIEKAENGVEFVVFDLPEKELVAVLAETIYESTKYHSISYSTLSWWQRIKFLFKRTIAITHTARKDIVAASISNAIEKFKQNSCTANFAIKTPPPQPFKAPIEASYELQDVSFFNKYE